MKRELLSAAEIAALKLPGLPTSRDNIRARAEREHWHVEERVGRGGSRRVYLVPEKYWPGNGRPAGTYEGLSQLREQEKDEGIADADLLAAIIEGIERFAARNDLALVPERKAALITLFYRYFREEGAVNQETLTDLMRKVG